ncbi:TetR/AcrR family transcriptional regulator [Rhodococcus sp. NPDC058521]|uniref:TetR/AcrR family transcriptional regulator n=1 Tax=Rhodococcus sp. NPDC058521 TaxID=3346536 RepID=UPI0036551090
MSIRKDEDVATSVEDLILDAARSCILDFGIRRTTLAEIARRAGVSRPTVYRRWSDTRAVVADLMTREIAAVMPVPDPTATRRTQLADSAVTVAERMCAHPLFDKILKFDQDMFGTYVFERLGTSQKAAIELVSAGVLAGQDDGSIRSGDSRHMATMLLLMVQSVVQSMNMVSSEMHIDDVLTELRAAVDSYLAPAR